MRKNYLSLSLGVLVFAIACAPTKTIYLDENYEKNSITSSFAVVPIQKEWVPDAVITPLTGTTKEYLYLALESGFSKSTLSPVEIFNEDVEFPVTAFERKMLDAENLSIEITLPPDSLLNSFPERYVYFLEGYGFRVAEQQTTGSSYAGNEASSYRVLMFQTEFYLYDKTTKEIISWGLVGDQAPIASDPEYNHYLDIMTRVSHKIVKESPFRVVSP
ncbi:MAG: hypothetical protein ED557_11290 [Balneola sp.]|nr:MAG: hypothetical protein ED557_11290 [Balneola sp.]